MRYAGKLLAAILGLGSVYFAPLQGGSVEEQKKSKMLNDLDAIKHTFEVHYAPATWKKTYSNWDLDQALAQAKNEVLSKEKITTKQFQSIVRKFLGTTKDYHVQIYFLSTELATLPFEVKSAAGRYFITWVDTDTLSPNNYPIRIGDELVIFNGKPIADVIEELKKEAGVYSNLQTDQALAEMTLTYRHGMRGDQVPKGPITIGLKSAAGSFYSYQLIWDYQPELILSPADMPWFTGVTRFTANLIDPFTKEKLKEDKSMLSPLYMLYDSEVTGHSIGIGTKDSFVPVLGNVVWDGEEEVPFFRTYIYIDEQGNTIGYIRIPNYSMGSQETQNFAELITAFQEQTDALVIDQVHNPGGFVIYTYALASMLTNQPFITPKHRISLIQEDVIIALYRLAILDTIDDDNEAQDFFSEDNFFRDYQHSLFLKDFYQFEIDEWNAGRLLTNPTHIEGVDHINPHPTARYTKPILVLIDHLDFSGGDFFPAILQDNKRAVLFGTRTAGAGGYIDRASFPNSNGIAGFTYTASIAERMNHQPIENLGITPDIEYQITPEDLQTNYKPYAAAVNHAVRCLLETRTWKK